MLQSPDPKMHSTDRCGCLQCELRAREEANAELKALALHAAEHIRSALENLYPDSVPVCGELRYHLLGRLSELERIGASLSKYAHDLIEDDELNQLKDRIANCSDRAGELEQEVRLLLDAWNRPRINVARSRTTSTRKLTSSRRSVPSLTELLIPWHG